MALHVAETVAVGGDWCVAGFGNLLNTGECSEFGFGIDHGFTVDLDAGSTTGVIGCWGPIVIHICAMISPHQTSSVEPTGLSVVVHFIKVVVAIFVAFAGWNPSGLSCGLSTRCMFS